MFNPKETGPLKVVAELATPEYCLDAVEMQIRDLKIAKEGMSQCEILSQITEMTRHLLIAGALLEDTLTMKD